MLQSRRYVVLVCWTSFKWPFHLHIHFNEGENKLPKNHSKLICNLKNTFEIGKRQLLLHIHPMKSLLSSFDKIWYSEASRSSMCVCLNWIPSTSRRKSQERLSHSRSIHNGFEYFWWIVAFTLLFVLIFTLVKLYR